MVAANGDFTWKPRRDITREPDDLLTATAPPDFGLGNYRTILTSDNMDLAFINTLTVTIPATDHPDPDRGLCRLCAGLDGL